MGSVRFWATQSRLNGDFQGQLETLSQEKNKTKHGYWVSSTEEIEARLVYIARNRPARAT